VPIVTEKTEKRALLAGITPVGPRTVRARCGNYPQPIHLEAIRKVVLPQIA